jgi:adenine-specific DNA-methyltransferase
MNKLDLHTPDFVATNAARLAELFPNCVTESRDPKTGGVKRSIDFDLLRQELAYDIVEGPQERYRLDWPGKREALALANAPIRKTLRPCKDESVDFDTTQNLYIEGDNLDALKLLQETYLGKVKMIYIDPPYNTGNDFIYDDNFSISGEEHDLLTGTRDEGGNAMFDEEKWKQNFSASGRFHSEWLSMMYPRLKLARNLLREDGVIFISIDDAEYANLRRLCDEIFGVENHLSTFVRRRRMSTGMRSNPLSPDHEYVLCFARSYEVASINGLKKDGDDFPLQDSKSKYRSTDLTVGMTREMRPNQYYGIKNPRTGKEFFPSESRVWRFDRITMAKQIDANNIIWPDDTPDSTMTRPRFKTRFLDETSDVLCNPITTWLSNSADGSLPYQLESPLNQAATREVRELFDSQLLEYPKPVRLIASLLHVGSGQEDIIVDFFSGSATTAHAVMQLNAEDGGKRRHIMVQIPERCDEKSEAFKAGYKTIAEIGKERIRRAGKKILEEWQAKQATSSEQLALETEHSDASPPDIGFRVLKIDSSNMADVYYQPDELTQDGLMLQVDNLKPGRLPEDLLFQVLLDWGVDLALPITEGTIHQRRVFFVAENALAACFDTGLDEVFVKELAQRQPLRAVFRDSGYASDAVKINFEQIFKALSPHTELKTL